MRLLADENIPLETVHALRTAGHDVYSATEGNPGASDLTHLDKAIRENRLIVTFDRDFGELAVRSPDKPTAGVLLLRFTTRSVQDITRLILDIVARADVELRGHISVVDDAHIRQRPL